MPNRHLICAGAFLALALGACSQSQPQSTSASDTAPVDTGSTTGADATAVGGGPSGQTPTYGQPGGAPSQVTSPGDARGPSVGENNPPIRQDHQTDSTDQAIRK